MRNCVRSTQIRVGSPHGRTLSSVWGWGNRKPAIVVKKKKHTASPVAITRIIIADVAEGYIAKLPDKFRLQIGHRIDALLLDPHPRGSKKLHGEVGPYGEVVYRERSGDYRIVYIIRGQAVVVLKVDDRKDVYK